MHTMVLGVCLIFCVGVLKPALLPQIRPSTVQVHYAQLHKFYPSHQYDIIVSGNSRIETGIVPAVMETILTDYRILNFGHGTSKMSPLTFDAIEQRLNSDTPYPVIVLGITPLGLTDTGASDTTLKGSAAWSFEQQVSQRYFPAVYDFFYPTTITEILNVAIRIGPSVQTHGIGHDDGWLELEVLHEDPTWFSQEPLINEHITPALIEGVMERTQDWVDRGITVFAFRPPTVALTVALENERTGFDEAEFQRQFEAAGGIWIDIPQDDYVAFDGSHLEREQAGRLSHELARKMRPHLPYKTISTQQ